MERYAVTFQPNQICVQVKPGTTLLDAQIAAGIRPDAPCGGKGTCGKCRVLLNGREVLACRTTVDRDQTVWTECGGKEIILSEGLTTNAKPDGKDAYVLAFDIGTTTVVGYLLSGITGEQLAAASAMNPQKQYGADVISRIQYALKGGAETLRGDIRNTLAELTEQMSKKAGITPGEITSVSIAGNTAMHHMLLGIDLKPLVTPPYMPVVYDAIERERVRFLPNIAGFVGGDTVGCMVAARFDELEELTLLLDIGTNGEMVLGNRKRRIACSTAAGPAFEGAKISCGMRGAEGAVDHVTLENGKIQYHVIGETDPKGICGSGLLDLVAVLLELGIIEESGRLKGKQYRLCENVLLTQKDVREVQLAKAAIRTGIELLAETMAVSVSDIQKVYLAGAFGNYLTTASACRIGMIPPALADRVVLIGNAAGEGAKLCGMRREAFLYSQRLAKGTEFLELASLPRFQKSYISALGFEPEKKKA